MQAYLSAFPSFLHLRQLSEYLAGRRMMAPGEPPLGGWFLMRALSTPEVTTVSPNVDTLYGGAYLLLREQGPVVLRVPRHPRPLLLGRADGHLVRQLRDHQPADGGRRRR